MCLIVRDEEGPLQSHTNQIFFVCFSRDPPLISAIRSRVSLAVPGFFSRDIGCVIERLEVGRLGKLIYPYD